MKNSSKKRWQAILMATLMAGSFAVTPSHAVDIYYRNEKIKTDVEPFIENGRTLVPIGVIAESMDAKVKWYPKERKLKIDKEPLTITLWLDRKDFGVEGSEGGYTGLLDVPAKSINGRTMVPLGMIAEVFGSEVVWDPKTKSVLIDSKSSSIEMSGKDYHELKMAQRIRNVYKNTPGREKYDLTKANIVRAEEQVFPYKDYIYELQERIGGSYELYEATLPNALFKFFVDPNTKHVLELKQGVYSLPDGEVVIPPDFRYEIAVEELIQELMLYRKVVPRTDQLMFKIAPKEKSGEFVYVWDVWVYESKPNQGKKKIAEYEVQVYGRKVISKGSGKAIYDDTAVQNYPEKLIGPKDVEKAVFERLVKLGRVDKNKKYSFTDRSVYGGTDDVEKHSGYIVTIREDSPDPDVSTIVGTFFINGMSTVLMEYDVVDDTFYYLYGRYTPKG